MGLPERYDLLVILAGDKPARHPAALTLAERGWARQVTVTGTHEWIDATPALRNRILPAPPSTSTYQDALSIRTLIQQHGFASVLVVTSATQAERARLTLARVLADLPVTIDVLTLTPAQPHAPATPTVARVLARQLSELAKLAYYHLRRRA